MRHLHSSFILLSQDSKREIVGLVRKTHPGLGFTFEFDKSSCSAP